MEDDGGEPVWSPRGGRGEFFVFRLTTITLRTPGKEDGAGPLRTPYTQPAQCLVFLSGVGGGGGELSCAKGSSAVDNEEEVPGYLAGASSSSLFHVRARVCGLCTKHAQQSFLLPGARRRRAVRTASRAAKGGQREGGGGSCPARP